MVGDSLNLVNLVRGYLTGGSVNQIASLLGESRDKTQSGVNAAIPGLLSGFESTASTPEGARRLSAAVDEADDGILSNVTGFFGKSLSSDAGAGTLRSVMGGNAFSGLAGGVSKSAGLSGKSGTALLGMLAPVVLGALRGVKRSKGLDASGLSSLLTGQRNHIAAAMPEGMHAAKETVREPLREVPHARATETYTYSEEPVRRGSSYGWILPLALLAGLLGLIWYWASRPNVQAGREPAQTTEQAARAPERAAPAATLESLKTKYSSAIAAAEAQGVKISSLEQRDGKLVIKGTAPSTEAANRVRDEIRRVNPRMDDVVAEIQVDPSLARAPSATPGSADRAAAPATGTATPDSSAQVAPAPRSGAASPDAAATASPNGAAAGTSAGAAASAKAETYVVQPGDTLSKISEKVYGNSGDYMRIFDANKNVLQNQHTVSVGQELKIPTE